MKIQTFSVLSLTVVLAGCVSPKVTSPPSAKVDLHEYRKVKLVVADSVNTPYSKEGTPMFEGLLKGKLESLGYIPVEKDPEMVLEVNLTDFDPGERALRMLVGLGAGRAVCKYTATMKDSSGELLAQMTGGKMYHGQELEDNPTLKSNESTRMGLIAYSVSQIGDFLQTNGGRKAHWN